MELSVITFKKLPPAGIEPETLGFWDLFVLHSHAFLTKLTWQVLIEGYLTSLLFVLN